MQEWELILLRLHDLYNTSSSTLWSVKIITTIWQWSNERNKSHFVMQCSRFFFSYICPLNCRILPSQWVSQPSVQITGGLLYWQKLYSCFLSWMWAAAIGSGSKKLRVGGGRIKQESRQTLNCILSDLQFSFLCSELSLSSVEEWQLEKKIPLLY